MRGGRATSRGAFLCLRPREAPAFRRPLHSPSTLGDASFARGARERTLSSDELLDQRGAVVCAVSTHRSQPTTSRHPFLLTKHLTDLPLPHAQEVEKLKALAKSIEASKKHLQQLEKDHSALESTVSANEKK